MNKLKHSNIYQTNNNNRTYPGSVSRSVWRWNWNVQHWSITLSTKTKHFKLNHLPQKRLLSHPVGNENTKTMYHHTTLGSLQVWKTPHGHNYISRYLPKAMNDIFGDLEYVLVYLDDIIILSNHNDAFEDHLKKVKTVFSGLHKMVREVSLLKTETFQRRTGIFGVFMNIP